jgi:hypothetical protein
MNFFKRIISKKENKKIFCIGFNKTGTTSLSDLFLTEGFKVAPQRPFELLLDEYLNKEYFKITDLIKKEYYDYRFFQDVPFSFPDFYKHLYKEFPKSIFILSVRNSSEEWYNSLIRFHSALIKLIIPTANLNDIKNINTWVYTVMTKVHNGLEDDIYNKENLIESYEKHNNDVIDFFKGKDNFIKINLSNPEDFKNLQEFLNIKFKSEKFPHLVKTT